MYVVCITVCPTTIIVSVRISTHMRVPFIRLGIQALEYGQVTQMAFLNLKRESVNLGCCKVKTSTLGTLSK